ncbi:hypothetical protein BJ322DRAFT_891889 [Thelephora terrestris]|uniref:F-box domain-containing protein n=1 Tax=Thelephora terrestris TaxID=56493 RepID=A0A9P6L5D9_9AGAM|nr:hypothetical protein BJ322DRAFT_891889 [Thelephora terrestris]
MDILSLIPTHLTSQKDRFYASSVCRHWRRTLQHGPLWTQLLLRKGEDYVSTLLQRGKGSALDIITHCDAPAGAVMLVSPRAQQIRHLGFTLNSWLDIIMFSQFDSGQLPLLRILEITALETPNSQSRHNPLASTSISLFGGSIDTEKFFLSSRRLHFLRHFVFPNLTTFVLSSYPEVEWSASCLLNFLKSSPKLWTVEVNISAKIELGGFRRERLSSFPMSRHSPCA